MIRDEAEALPGFASDTMDTSWSHRRVVALLHLTVSRETTLTLQPM
jgi:hypothetical protein